MGLRTAFAGWLVAGLDSSGQQKSGFDDLLEIFKRGFSGGDSNVTTKRQRFADYNVWAYAAVEAIAVNAGDVPWKLEVNEREVPDSNELYQLLENPGPELTWEDLIGLTCAQLVVLRTSHWILEPADQIPRSLSRLPDEIVIDDPRRLERQTNGSWIWRREGKPPRRLPAEAVLTFRKPSLYDPLAIMAKSDPVGEVVAQQLFAERFNTNFFRNGARLGLIVSSDENLSRAGKKNLLQSFRRDHDAKEKAHGLTVLEGGLKVTHDQATHRDMEFRGLDEVNMEKVLGFFRMPPIMVGSTKSEAYNNQREQRRAFYMDVLLPTLRGVRNRVNYSLARRFARPERLEWNTRGIPALQKDYGPLITTASGMYDRGIPWSVIDTTLELDLPLEEMGDAADAQLIKTGYERLEDVLADPPEPAPAPPAPPADDDPSDDDVPEDDDTGDPDAPGGDPQEEGKSLAQRMAARMETGRGEQKVLLTEEETGDEAYDKATRIWQKNMAQRRRLDKERERAYERVIYRMRTDLLRAAGEYFDPAKGAQGVDKNAGEGLYDALDAAYQKTEVRLDDWYRGTWKAGMQAGATQAYEDAGFGRDEFPQAAYSVLASKEIRLSEQLGAPKEAVRVALEQTFAGMLGGEYSLAEVERAVRDAIKGAADSSQRRAKTIARTEVGTTMMSAKWAWMEENGATHGEWVAARRNTRETHAFADGEVVKVGERFPIVNLLYPMEDGGPPEEVINCQCDYVPVRREESRR